MFNINKNNMANLSLEQKEAGVPSDRVIVLKNPKKTKCTVQPAYDPRLRWYAGIPRMSEDDKKGMEYYTTPESRIKLEDNISFDLNDDVDRANWEWLKHLKEIAPDFESYKSNPAAEFYVYIEGREARNNNKNTATTFDAQKCVFEDDPENYADRALLLGNDMTGEDPSIIKEYLLEMAKNIKTAPKVLEIYNSKSLSLQLLYLKAKKKGEIQETDGVIKFGLNVLGVSDESAIAFLQEPSSRSIVDLLDQAVNPEYWEEKEEKEAKVVKKGTASKTK